MKIITVESLIELLHHHGFDNFMMDLMRGLTRDFRNWNSFTQVPRLAMHVENGVLELMPTCDNKQYYTFKYVNCHPKNPHTGKLTVVATGQLVEIDTGYPLLFSEMTILTALRTAAVAAIATNFMARENSHVIAIIGTGAQSEFQVRALRLVRDIKEVRYFDIDHKAMDKFEKNLHDRSLRLVRCNSAEEATLGVDIITICTARKGHFAILKNKWLKDGVHINALGGDTIGKTELERSILKRSKIVVEYFDQAIIEGEVQQLGKDKAKELIYAELHEIIIGSKMGRGNDQEITLFDSVGIALEDYSALRLTYELSEKYNIGEMRNMVPVIKNPKDLIGAIM